MGRYNFRQGKIKSQRRLEWRSFMASLVLLVGCCYGLLNLRKTDASSIRTAASFESKTSVAKGISWPKYGQAAVVVDNSKYVAVSDDAAKPVPIASLAKVITALAVLEKKPLNVGEQGPSIPVTQQDIDTYQYYAQNSGSIVYIENGEQDTEYQALAAMLLPSSNNHADMLARWAFGSMDNYTAYANAMVARIGLKDTHIADASGFSPKTISTAHDMAVLGELYMNHPVLKQIAETKEFKMPTAGVIKNYNDTINSNQLTGIKVGNTDEAGRCFIIADQKSGSTSVAVVLGAEHIDTAMNDAKSILESPAIKQLN